MIVERQPVDDLIRCGVTGRESHPMKPRHFQRTPQGLRGAVIPAIAFAAHRRSHVVRLDRFRERLAAVLAPYGRYA